MAQPTITLTAGTVVIDLDPDLRWSDEFDWYEVEQTVERSLGGSLVVDQAVKAGGRPITLAPPGQDAAWMPRATLSAIQALERQPHLIMQLDLRGAVFDVIFRRHDAAPISAEPVVFVADPEASGFGDWYLSTIRFLTV
jgi:hypothetical protein